MKLSRGSEIAVDLLVYCAQRPDRMIRIREAAAFAQATEAHAHQIASKLVRSGLLESVRGKRGGIRVPNAGEVTVGEVVRAMQSQPAPPKVSHGNSTLSILVNEAAQSAFDILNAFTIADLVRNRRATRPDCATCEFRAGHAASHTPFHVKPENQEARP